MVDPTPFRRPVKWAKLRADDAERVIRERAKDTDNIIISGHAYERISEREIVLADVRRILQAGMIEGDPIRNETGEWQAIMVKRIRGRREAAAVTVIFQGIDKLLVRTVMWMD